MVKEMQREQGRFIDVYIQMDKMEFIFLNLWASILKTAFVHCNIREFTQVFYHILKIDISKTSTLCSPSIPGCISSAA